MDLANFGEAELKSYGHIINFKIFRFCWNFCILRQISWLFFCKTWFSVKIEFKFRSLKNIFHGFFSSKMIFLDFWVTFDKLKSSIFANKNCVYNNHLTWRRKNLRVKSRLGKKNFFNPKKIKKMFFFGKKLLNFFHFSSNFSLLSSFRLIMSCLSRFHSFYDD